MRKPLGAFFATLVVGAALLGVGMTAFGGTSGNHGPTPLTQAQFVRLGTRMCVSLRQQLKAVTVARPSNLRQAARPVRRTISMFDGLLTTLYGLLPPPSADAPFRHLLGNLETADHALHRLDHLAETQQPQRAAVLVRSRWWQGVGRRLRSAAKPKAIPCGRVRHTAGVFIALRTRAFVGMSAASRYSARPLSIAQFAQVGERVCVSLRQQLEDVMRTQPRDATEAAEKIQRITSIVDGLTNELRGVVPPPAAAAPFRQVVSNIERADSALNNLNALTAMGQWRSAERLVRSAWFQNIGKALGPPVSPEDMRCS